MLSVVAVSLHAQQEMVYTPSGIVNYSAITAGGRVDWITSNTVGYKGLAGVAFSAAWGTLQNEPKEYGPTWKGFGKRAGIRLSTLAVDNIMEASIGGLWGEDPRYAKATGQPFKGRLGQVIRMTFMAENRNGRLMPAYSRYIAIPGANFLSNAWRADSEATVSEALQRTAWGFVGRMTSNAFEEFWPDLRRKIFKK